MKDLSSKSLNNLVSGLNLIDRQLKLRDSYRTGVLTWAALHVARNRILEELSRREDVQYHVDVVMKNYID